MVFVVNSYKVIKKKEGKQNTGNQEMEFCKMPRKSSKADTERSILLIE